MKKTTPSEVLTIYFRICERLNALDESYKADCVMKLRQYESDLKAAKDAELMPVIKTIQTAFDRLTIEREGGTVLMACTVDDVRGWFGQIKSDFEKVRA